METLKTINNMFDKLKYIIKCKSALEGLPTYKRDIQALNMELMILGKENQDMFIRSLAMESYLVLLSAKTLPLPPTDKRNMLQVAFEKLNPYRSRRECLFIYMRIQNLLCYYMIQLDQIACAKDLLEDMEKFCDTIDKSGSEKYIDAEDLFNAVEVNCIAKIDPAKMDKVITNNIEMQAFVYNKLGMSHEHTVYGHAALQRRLELKEGTPQNWAAKVARLGNYFTCLEQPYNARHHLAAAYRVLRTCRDNCRFLSDKTAFEIRSLELIHYWVKYGLMLFKLSKKRILNRYFSQNSSKEDLWHAVDAAIERERSGEENVKIFSAEQNAKGDYDNDKCFKFTSLDLHDIEDTIPVECVTDCDGARRVFSFTHKWLMRANNYYDFEHHSAQYISCSLQLAELYEHLAFFERKLDNQYNIQKRRADVLEALNSLLKNCDNVMSVQIDVIRELSQVQLELMALNLQKLWREESQANVLNLDNDTDSIINSLKRESTNTLTDTKVEGSSKNLFLRKMEAASCINGKLFRLCSELLPHSASKCSLSTSMFE